MVGIITLVIGVIIGYLGQRSRFCIISGIRDFYLVKDAQRLTGLFGVIIASIVGFSIVKRAGGDLLGFPLLSQGFKTGTWVLTLLGIVGAFGMAFFSVQAEGCPFRQHVMAGEGRISGVLYLTGLIVGIIFFDLVVVHFIRLFTILGG